MGNLQKRVVCKLRYRVPPNRARRRRFPPPDRSGTRKLDSKLRSALAVLRVDLVEDAAIGEVRLLRVGPAAEDIVDRESLHGPELARILGGGLRITRAIVIPARNVLTLGAIEILEVLFRHF